MNTAVASSLATIRRLHIQLTLAVLLADCALGCQELNFSNSSLIAAFDHSHLLWFSFFVLTCTQSSPVSCQIKPPQLYWRYCLSLDDDVSAHGADALLERFKANQMVSNCKRFVIVIITKSSVCAYLTIAQINTGKEKNISSGLLSSLKWGRFRRDGSSFQWASFSDWFSHAALNVLKFPSLNLVSGVGGGKGLGRINSN